jgi:protein SCO1/2
MASHKLTMWLILVAAVAAAAGLWAAQRLAPRSPAAAPATSAAVLYPQPRPLPAFALTRSDATPYTQADLVGAWTLMFFGFTHCPDVCPTTLATLRDAHASLPPALAARVRMTFVSIDPERDTPQRAGEYARYFSPAIVAATGTPEALQTLTGPLGVVYMKAPLASGDYSMDHSASILLIDPQGRLRGLFRPPLDARRIADDLAALAGE